MLISFGYFHSGFFLQNGTKSQTDSAAGFIFALGFSKYQHQRLLQHCWFNKWRAWSIFLICYLVIYIWYLMYQLKGFFLQTFVMCRNCFTHLRSTWLCSDQLIIWDLCRAPSGGQTMQPTRHTVEGCFSHLFLNLWLPLVFKQKRPPQKTGITLGEWMTPAKQSLFFLLFFH